MTKMPAASLLGATLPRPESRVSSIAVPKKPAWTTLRVVVGILLIGLGVLVTAPTLEANTSQWVDLTAHVSQPPTIQKVALADPPISQGEVDEITQATTGATGCLQADAEPPIEVPIETCVWWVLRIAVTNSTGGEMHDLMVVDRFGAELGVGEFLDYVPVEVVVVSHSRGQSGTGTFDTQHRVVWCVTNGEPGPVDPINDETCVDPVPPDPLMPGESAFIDLLVFTRLNPSGRQEYTSTGTYTMNSGATATWEQGTAGGPQASDSTDSILVTAFEEQTPDPALYSSTGQNSCNSQAPVTSGSGDNDGFQRQPHNLCDDGSGHGRDDNSGNNSSTNCTDTGKDRHDFWDFGVQSDIPLAATIEGIEIRLDAWARYGSGDDPGMCVQLSWDGGNSWTSSRDFDVGGSQATFIVGDEIDTWGRTWTREEFTDSNFRVRVTNVSNDGGNDFRLDYVAAEAHYSYPAAGVSNSGAGPAPSPAPIADPAPTAIPAPIPTTAPDPPTIPTPVPTATPLPTAIPTTAPDPSTTPTPAATATPSPSAIPTTAPESPPTPTPAATATSSPTAIPTTAPESPTTPTPAPTATPSPTAIPTTAPDPSTIPTPEPAPAAMPTAATDPSNTPVAGQ